MIDMNIGQVAAFVTAICWTITPIAFEAAGKRVGSLSVNFIRLIIAFLLIGIFTFFTRGMFLPLDASGSMWLWLSISGVIGFVLGDLFLFEAFVLIGSRISLLIMAVVPPITALIGFFILGERLTVLDLLGMFITMGGISLVILVKGSKEKKVTLSHPLKGISYAFIGAVGQAVGMVFSKLGMGDYNAFAATQIRIIAATVAFAIIITLRKNWGKLSLALKDFKALKYISIGSFFGPFIGVSFSLLAVQYIPTGVASTISSISRILIIPVSILAFKEKVSAKEILGATITIGGVALLFL